MIITAGRPGEQPCWSEPWTRFSARTGVMQGISFPDRLPVETHLQVGVLDSPEQARNAGSLISISGSSISSGTTGGYSATGLPALTFRNRPGPRSRGTPWSRAGRHPMTLTWPGYCGLCRQKATPPLDDYTVGLLSRQDSAGAACAGKPCLPPTSRPRPLTAGNAGSCRSPGRRSRRTTWSTTARSAAARHHLERTSCTPRATASRTPARLAGGTVMQQMT